MLADAVGGHASGRDIDNFPMQEQDAGLLWVNRCHSRHSSDWVLSSSLTQASMMHGCVWGLGLQSSGEEREQR